MDKDIIENFQYGLYDVLKHQTLPEVAQLTGIKVELPEGGYEITRQENSGLAYSDDYVWFMDGKALDNDLTQTLLDMVTNLNLSECVDYNASDLSLYGLDAPAVTATVLDGGKAGLYAGDQRLGGRRVLRAPERFQDDLPAGRRSQRYPALHHLRRFTARRRDSDGLGYGAERRRHGWSGEESVLTRTTEEKTDDEGTVTEETVWKLDGQEVKFAPVLNSLSGMTSSGYAAGITPEGEPEITFRILRDRENFSEVTCASTPTIPPPVW